MVRVVTQETYDEVVKENMEEFDMSPEDAIKEATAQFEAQGVDLSNIIKDLALGEGDGHLVSATIDRLKKLNNDDDEGMMKEMNVLKIECDKDIAHRIRAGKDGAYKVLLDILEPRHKIYLQDKKEKDGKVVLKVIDALVALMDTQPDLLDEHGIEIIKSTLDNVENEDILISTLKWTTNCLVKHEMNKQAIFSKDIGNSLKKLLVNRKNPKIISQCLQVIRKFTLDDDVRVEFGRTHEHSRDLAMILLEPLTKLLKENTKPPLVSELMLTMASLLVRHELCKTVSECGMELLYVTLTENYDNPAVITQANKLITALAGNDDVKRDLVRSGLVPILISLLNRHSSNAVASAYGLKCVAALTLREPEHSQQFLENGVPEAIVQCMKIHPDDAAVQKNACWAIRNMVARCQTHNATFHSLGIQDILDAAYKRFGGEFGFDVKSALRDLGCDVTLDEQWTGRGVQLEQ